MLKKDTIINTILICIVIALVIVPFYIAGKSDFNGADAKSAELINSINPEYKPWFKNIWEPPGKEIETLMFCLQAAIGSGVVFFIIGYYKGKRNRK